MAFPAGGAGTIGFDSTLPEETLMKCLRVPVLLMFLIAGYGAAQAQPGNPTAGLRAIDGGSLAEARKGFRTVLMRKERDGTPIPVPPEKVFKLVHYTAPVGKLGAYISPDPKDGNKHPAIIWITGGDSNTIGELWEDKPAANDQSAAAYRKAGIVMMFPSLRGGNDNPGFREGFLGEVDDVLAAATYLASQPYVDPARIYLGGHSTGGTLVLLTAQSSNRFRAVFSFGPVAQIEGYGSAYLPFDTSNPLEAQLRSPGQWLASIQVPVFVFEGLNGGNVVDAATMQKKSRNPQLKIIPVQGASHFSVLAPTNRIIAQKILDDTGPTSNISISMDEVTKPFKR